MKVTRMFLHDQVLVIRGHLENVVVILEELVAEAELVDLEVELVLETDLRDLLELLKLKAELN